MQNRARVKYISAACARGVADVSSVCGFASQQPRAGDPRTSSRPLGRAFPARASYRLATRPRTCSDVSSRYRYRIHPARATGSIIHVTKPLAADKGHGASPVTEAVVPFPRVRAPLVKFERVLAARGPLSLHPLVPLINEGLGANCSASSNSPRSAVSILDSVEFTRQAAAGPRALPKSDGPSP